MNKEELKTVAAKAGITTMFLGYILAGKRSPSRETAKRLEEITSIHRLWWLYPNEYDKRGSPINSRRTSPRRQKFRRCADRGGEDRRQHERRGEGDQGPKEAA